VLSEGARRHLDSHPRADAVPTAEVERILRREGIEPLEPWLDFHDRYAGHILDLGAGDRAALGLVQRHDGWWPAGTVGHFAVEDGEQPSEIFCADAHPSYGYVLSPTGRLHVGPTESFDIFMEQAALRVEVCDEIQQRTGWPPQVLVNVTEPDLLDLLATEASPVHEASDEYHSYVAGDGVLGVRDLGGDRWVYVVTARTGPPEPPPGWRTRLRERVASEINAVRHILPS
jgi:hypothetical protein